MRKQFGGDLQSEVNSNTAQIRELQEQVKKLQAVIEKPSESGWDDTSGDPTIGFDGKPVEKLPEDDPWSKASQEKFAQQQRVGETAEQQNPVMTQNPDMTDCEIYNKCVTTNCNKKTEQQSKLANKICEKLKGQGYIDLERDPIDCNGLPRTAGVVTNKMKQAMVRYNASVPGEREPYTKELVNEVFTELGCATKLAGGKRTNKRRNKKNNSKKNNRKNKKTNRKNNRKINKKSKRN